LRELSDGGIWNTIAGQPTDDSEMALLLARMSIECGTCDPNAAFDAYKFWLDSDPFDCGMTTSAGLREYPNAASQANGAMLRISPLGTLGARHSLDAVREWVMQDAALTHPNPVCLQANSLFTMATAHAISSGCDRETLYRKVK
jgi:ADP-ribosylglycohydrolase